MLHDQIKIHKLLLIVIMDVNRILLVLSVIILYSSFSNNILFLSESSYSNSLLFIYSASISVFYKQAFSFSKVMKIIFFLNFLKEDHLKVMIAIIFVILFVLKNNLKVYFFLMV